MTVNRMWMWQTMQQDRHVIISISICKTSKTRERGRDELQRMVSAIFRYFAFF